MANIWQRLIKPIKILAPMEDVTDTVFRRIVARCGRPDLFFTEFTSTDGIFSAGRETVCQRLRFMPEERPLIAQIWGLKPENYFRAAKLLGELGFDGIDINMGCPVQKIIQKGACSGLIENPQLAKEIFLATREGAGELPVSIKTRLGFRSVQTEEWLGFLLALKPAAITVHGRVAKQLSKYPANWEEIGKVVKLRDQLGVETLVIGNGDVNSLADLTQKVALYGVDGVMVGRAIFQNLTFFNPDSAQPEFRKLGAEARLSLLRSHVELHHETWQVHSNYNSLKKFFKIYVSDFRGAAELRAELIERTHCLDDFYAALNYWLQVHCSIKSEALQPALDSPRV